MSPPPQTRPGPNCPHCGKSGDVLQHLSGNNSSARPGAISLCASCREPSVFSEAIGGGLTLRLPTATEQALMDGDREFQRVLTKARRAPTVAAMVDSVTKEARHNGLIRVVAAYILGAQCPICYDTGYVCKNHPDFRWGSTCCPGTGGTNLCTHGACHCGPGVSCYNCPGIAAAERPHGILAAAVRAFGRD